jgi:CRISPR-associated protein Cas5d
VTSFCLEVEGEYACFTRPEMKVERVSYEVITPSAARAVFEAILWKPAIAWQVERIEVLRPIRWLTVRRNEVASKIPVRNVQTAMRTGGGVLGLYVDDDRQQRGSLILRDVAYRIWAHFGPGRGPNADDPLAKYEAMFRRRAEHGQCVAQPYLGTREFACRFTLVDGPPGRAPIDETRELGIMLYDLDYAEPDRPTPIWFRARMERGTIEVPGRGSPELLRCPRPDTSVTPGLDERDGVR